MTSPAVHSEAPRVAVASGCMLGEGALWDHRNATLLWVDIKNPAIWRYDPHTDKSVRLPMPERIGFVALTDDPKTVIGGLKSGLARIDLESGAIAPIIAPEPDLPGNRINDGHVGPDGSLYFGTMDDGEEAPSGSFWRWDGKSLTRFHKDIPITNGPAVSHDGKILYSIDSKGRLICAHDLTKGEPGAPRFFARFEESWGNPDGMAVDATGHIWVCHWGASRITRFAPDGTVERILPVPTAQVTKCAFGGPDLTTLYITSAGIGRDPTHDPMAGRVFVVEPGIKGLPANIFKG